ncbi:MAG: hypothetical protein ACM3ZO_09470 [Clostridia bacterium]
MTSLRTSLVLERRLAGGRAGLTVGRTPARWLAQFLAVLGATALTATAASVLLGAAAAAAISGDGSTSGGGTVTGTGFLIAQAGAGGAQLPAGAQMVERQSAERDLVWLLAGIMDMERDKKLALTRNQATSVWPIFKSLVEEGLIRLDVDPAQFEIRNRPGRQGEVQGQIQIQVGQGQGIMGKDDPKLQEMRKQREVREERIRQAIDKIEKLLSAKQIAYVDNFEFDPAKYGLGSRLGEVRPGSGHEPGQWTPPTQQDVNRLMEIAKENAQKLADFYKGFQSFIQKKAGIKP